MFNIKNIVNKITERGRESQPNSPGRTQTDDISSRQAAEGFLCPKCMQAFPSPEELQAHYVSSHNTGEETVSELPASGIFQTLHQEVGEFYQLQEDEQVVEGQQFLQLDTLIQSMHKGESAAHDVPYTDPSITNITNVGDLQKMVAESYKSKLEVQQEKQKLEQRLAQLAQENASLKALADESQENQTALKERLKVVEAQLAHRESIDDAAVLRQELVQVQRVMDELTREKERERDELKAQLQELKDIQASSKDASVTNEEAEREKLQLLVLEQKEYDAKLCKLEIELSASKAELLESEQKLSKEQALSQKLRDSLNKEARKTDDYYKELTTLQDSSAQEKEKMNLLQKKNEEVILEIGKLQKTLLAVKEERDTAQKKLENAEEEIQASQCRFDAINKQKDILKSELMHKSKLHEDAEEQILVMKEKIASLEKDLEEKARSIESERQQFMKDIMASVASENEDLVNLTQEKAQLNIKIKELQESHQSDMVGLQNKFKEKEMELKTVKANFEKKLEITEKNLSEQKKWVENLNDQVVRQAAEMEEMRKLEENLRNEKKAQKKEMEEIITEKSSLIEECNKKIKDTENQLTEARNMLVAKEEAIITLEKCVAESTSKMNDLEEVISTEQMEIFSLQQDLINSNKELSVKKAELSKLEQDFKAEVKHLKENIKIKEDKIKAQDRQIQVIEIQRASLETSLFESEKLVADLEEENKRVKDSTNKEIQTLKAETQKQQMYIEELEEAKSLLLKEQSELSAKVSETTDNLAKLKADIADLESQLSSTTSAKETAELDLAKEKKIGEDLKEQIKVLKINLDAQMEKKNQQLKDVQSSFDEIAGEKLALEAQLATSQAEQQTLLERCYASSAESENLRKTISELRRKHEESQAALHELGRENQTLQLELEKLLGRKWTEDSDAISCMLCSKEFSLLVRKHHCRNCGQIFCSDCSSKMTPVASNKKPVRVCDSCYNELSNK